MKITLQQTQQLNLLYELMGQADHTAWKILLFLPPDPDALALGLAVAEIAAALEKARFVLNNCYLEADPTWTAWAEALLKEINE